MRKPTSWILAVALLAPAALALSGCDKGITTPPAQVQAHMKAKDQKEDHPFANNK